MMAKTGQQLHKMLSEKEILRREIMDKFDDIPIKELNKVEAY